MSKKISKKLNAIQLEFQRLSDNTARPTTDNPMDEISFQHWKHRVTNICLDATQVALQGMDDTTSLKY
jgi:hypothetical protein